MTLRGRDPGPDSGLLSPVRAGTPVEAAVSDVAWLQAMLDAETALVRAQASLGTVPAAAAARITACARAEDLDLCALARAARETANPVVGLVAAFAELVAREDPGAAELVHRGSTSQDVLDTATMIVAKRAVAVVRADLAATHEALTTLAREHRDTVAVARTLALHAVPTTFGLRAAGWRRLVADAVERLDALTFPVSVGGAAGTLAGYLEHAGDAGAEESYATRLVEAVAAETGLGPARSPWHVVRTPMADLAQALSFTATALGKVAADVLGLARTEVAEVREPTRAGRGVSSAMPHKQNPVLSVMIRSVAAQAPALASIVVGCLQAEDERSAGLWHAEWWPLRELLRLVGGAADAARELAGGLEIRAEAAGRNLALTAGGSATERISARLTPALGRAGAREVVTRAAQEAARGGAPLVDALAEVWARAVPEDPDGLTVLLDPLTFTGAAGSLVDDALRTPLPDPS